MGRKTRREKVLAEMRRRTQLLKVMPQGISFLGQSTVTLDQPVITPATKQPVPDKETVTSAPVAHNLPPASGNADYAYVLSDLRRIGLLTALAICAQLVLWYVLGKRI